MAINFIASTRMVTPITAISFDLSGDRIICEFPTILIAVDCNSQSEGLKISIGGVDRFETVFGSWGRVFSH
jgi:hypothetical protein